MFKLREKYKILKKKSRIDTNLHNLDDMISCVFVIFKLIFYINKIKKTYVGAGI